MDIDVSHVEDCKRLAKQCKMGDLIDELESKCKQVYEFGKLPLLKSPEIRPTRLHCYMVSHLSLCVCLHA